MVASGKGQAQEALGTQEAGYKVAMVVAEGEGDRDIRVGIVDNEEEGGQDRGTTRGKGEGEVMVEDTSGGQHTTRRKPMWAPKASRNRRHT